MNNFKVGDLINTNLTNSIVIGVYGNDAILYSKSDYIEQYVYAHNIEYDEKENKYVWTQGDYYSSLEECMKPIMVNKKENFYDLINYAINENYRNYIKGIVRVEKGINNEEILDSIYDEYIDSNDIENFFSNEVEEIFENGIINNYLNKHEKWLDSGGKDGNQLNVFEMDLDTREILLEYSDLNNADLRNSILADNELIAINFTRANLDNCDMTICNLKGCLFDKTSLSKINLEEAVIEEETKFINTNIKDSTFKHAYLYNSIFKKTNLDNVNFNYSKLQNVEFSEDLIVNTENIELNKVDFKDSVLDNTIFSKCNITNSSFSGSHLNKVDFKYSKLKNVSINHEVEDIVLVNACNFYAIDFENVSFKNAFIQNCEFTNISMKNVDFTGAKIVSTKMDKEIKDYILSHGGIIEDKTYIELHKEESLLEKAPISSYKTKDLER